MHGLRIRLTVLNNLHNTGQIKLLGPSRISTPHRQIQSQFGLLKIVQLTAKAIHVNYQMQQDKVVHHMPMHNS